MKKPRRCQRLRGFDLFAETVSHKPGPIFHDTRLREPLHEVRFRATINLAECANFSSRIMALAILQIIGFEFSCQRVDSEVRFLIHEKLFPYP